MISRPELPTTDIIDADAHTIALTVPERFLLLLLLPQSGNRQQMRVAASVEELVSFTDAETALFAIRQLKDGTMLFNPETSAPVELGFSEPQRQLIREAVIKADTDGRITREMLPLLDKLDTL